MVRKKIPVLRQASLRVEVASVPGGGTARAGARLPWEEPWAPVMDVWEKEDRVVIEAELPGVEPADISLLVRHNRVELQGKMRRERHRETARYHRLERPSGSFRRTVALPCVILPDRTQALLDNGVLSVVLFKAGGGEARKNRRPDPSRETTAPEKEHG
ncbi:MAG: Hsp20/alpha crystallin family protein [Candidatus Aminicenantes bacterium]|nr:Hsp20/alpha crystallin family protein [Candidatus Aminicenantes bacterium]